MDGRNSMSLGSMKQCTVCKVVKPTTDFYTYYRGNKTKAYCRSSCKKCHSQQLKKYIQEGEYHPVSDYKPISYKLYAVIRNIFTCIGIGDFKTTEVIIRHDELSRQNIRLSRDLYDVVELDLK